jgi:hypothetical protein
MQLNIFLERELPAPSPGISPLIHNINIAIPPKLKEAKVSLNN